MPAELPKLALGTWLMGGTKEADPNNDDAKDIAVIHTAIENDVTLIDTAQNYAAGKCEELVGKAISKYSRQSYQILTKQSKDALHYDAVIKGCHDSMQRLGVEYVDYFVCHAPTKDADMRDFFKASNQLYKDGFIRNVGVSNFGPKTLAIALETSDLPISLNQVSFSLGDDDILTTGTYDFCVENNIPIQAFRALARLGEDTQLISLLLPIAEKHGLTAHQTALAYLNSYKNVNFTIRASNKEHWQQIKKALNVALAAEETEQLRKVQTGKQGAFHEFLLV